MDRDRLERRLDKMTASGRITQEEADGLRAAAQAGEAESAAVGIRRRHMSERVAHALRDGRVTQEQADEILRRLDEGEDPRSLVHLLNDSGSRSGH